jgi:riboflavin synthase
MFTGIVEELGEVVALDLRDGGADARLVVRGPLVAQGTAPGASIAVDGACLTVVEVTDDGTFAADVMPETLRRTALGDLVPGRAVNLERAVPVSGRLDGHVVQGHVDGVGVLLSRTPGDRWDDLVIGLDEPLAPFVAEKGSIAVAGVSLTVTAVGADRFGVSLIPTTLASTTLGAMAPGARVNLEVDVLAKYVARLLAAGEALR